MSTQGINNRMYYSHDAEMRAQRERFVLALIVLALGIGFGSAVALLFAPQSGERTRRALEEVAETVVDRVGERVR